MARKKIVVSSSGGIAAGVPFVAGGYLFVQQASPPVAASGRLVQVTDAVQSITAKGVTAALRTFMLGNAVGEGTGNLRSIFLGDTISGPPGGGAGTAQDQILIGTDITQPAAFVTVDTTILIGNRPTLGAATGVFGNSVYLGHNLTITPAGGAVDTVGSVLIGAGGTVKGGTAVGIGSSVIVASESVNIGNSAIGTGTQSVGVGKAVNLNGNNCVAVGRRARGGTDSVALGFFADTLAATSGIAIGRDADAGAFAGSVVIGRGTVALEANSVALGGDLVNGFEARVLRIGPNTLAGYPGLGVFLPSAAAGNNIDAPNTTFRGGISTGNAVAKGRIIFQSSTQGVAGGAYQAIVDRLRIAPGGVAGIPTIEFVNQISTPGAGAGTLLNAPAAGNPAIWAEVLYNGVLHFIPMW